MSPRTLFLFSALAVLLLLACNDKKVQSPGADTLPTSPSAYALDGTALFPLKESEQTLAKKDSLLRLVHANYLKDSLNLDNIIWYGRRLAYLYKYNDAIAVFSRGLTRHPKSPELYRHRGHRYISIRKFDTAAADLKNAAELATGLPVRIEPDGIPNKINKPLSNLQFNIYYHWALAEYLQGHFDRAAILYDSCMTYSNNNDLLVATTDWYYMTLRRLGQHEAAKELLNPISPDMEIIENASYHQRLLMYKGLVPASELLDLENTTEEAQLDIVTQGYGVGNWHLCNGDTTVARSIYTKIMACDYWPAFGYIAAEADLSRL